MIMELMGLNVSQAGKLIEACLADNENDARLQELVDADSRMYDSSHGAFTFKKPEVRSAYFVPGLPHIILITSKPAHILHQDYRMLLPTLSHR